MKNCEAEEVLKATQYNDSRPVSFPMWSGNSPPTASGHPQPPVAIMVIHFLPAFKQLISYPAQILGCQWTEDKKKIKPGVTGTESDWQHLNHSDLPEQIIWTFLQHQLPYKLATSSTLALQYRESTHTKARLLLSLVAVQHTDLLTEKQLENADTYRKICLLHVIKERTGVVVNVHGLRKTCVLGRDRAALHLADTPVNKTRFIYCSTPLPCWAMPTPTGPRKRNPAAIKYPTNTWHHIQALHSS